MSNSIFEAKANVNKLLDQVAKRLRKNEDKLNLKPYKWQSRPIYYNQRAALWAKSVLDDLNSRPTATICWAESDYDLTANTLYLRWNQGVRYLLDRLDPDKRYAKLYATLEVIRILHGEDRGIAFKFKEEALSLYRMDSMWREHMRLYIATGEANSSKTWKFAEIDERVEDWLDLNVPKDRMKYLIEEDKVTLFHAKDLATIKVQ